LKNSGKKAVTVRAQYQPDARRDAYVFINDVKIGVLSDGQSVSTFSIPYDLQTAEVLTLKIAKGEKRITPHVYEVRILKE
jgi:hypothetical protein